MADFDLTISDPTVIDDILVSLDVGGALKVQNDELAGLLTEGLINDLPAQLGAKVDDSQVLTDVPAGAVFTDTQVTVNSTLTSTSTTEALSAAQGKVLQDNKRDLIDLDFTELQLSALTEIKTSTVVDVFIYRTVNDSDGGAWRERCSALSWFQETLNTATRGKTRKFPAIALITAEADKLIIYDMTDPSMSMWMVIQKGVNYMISGGVITCVSMLNGELYIGSDLYGLFKCNFLSEYASINSGNTRVFRGSVAERHLPLLDVGGQALPEGIIGAGITDIAAVVLPNAPIPSATGLPIPVAYVATDSGLSRIAEDGVASHWTDSGGSYDVVNTVSILGDLVIFSTDSNIANVRGVLSQTTHSPLVDGTKWDDTQFVSFDATTLQTPLKFNSSYGGVTGYVADVCRGGIATNRSLCLYKPNYANMGTSLYTTVTSSFNSGYQFGDIKGAWLADTVAETVVGVELVTGDSSTFDTSVGDWVALVDGSISAVSGRLRVASTGGGLNPYSVYEATVIAGKTYSLALTSISPLAYGDWAVRVGSTSSVGSSDLLVKSLEPAGEFTFQFTATTTVAYVQIYGSSVALNGFADFDNVSLKLVELDRSYKNKGLRITGTIIKSEVATGSDLVGYSGFSASNYFEETSAVFVDTLFNYGWVKHPTNGWEFKYGLVSAGDIDGLTIAATVLHIEGTLPKALIRLTASVPTQIQIDQIYETEKHLFKEDTKCTLSGTSSDVKALAYDEVTKELQVCSNTDRSTFQGLVRVSEENVAYTSYSAQDSLTVGGN